jgi:hypothetical protein
MQLAEGVTIAGVENRLNGAPPDAAAAQPDERSEARRQLAEVEDLARCGPC